MGRIASNGIEKVGEDPLVDLMTDAYGQVRETDTTLSRRISPTDLPLALDAHARKSQLKAQADALLRAQRGNGLQGNTLVVEIANDSTVAPIQDDVGQGAQFMPVMGAGLPRGKRDDLHTLCQEKLGRGPFVRF